MSKANPNDVSNYNQVLRAAIIEHAELLQRYWPNGVRNVLSGNCRLFFNGGILCVGLSGHTSSDMPLLEYINHVEGEQLADVLYSLSSYLWKRMHNMGSGVTMPNVELPSARKYSHNLPAGGKAVTGYTDPKNPNVQVDIPGEIGPGSGPRQIGPGNPLLPPGGKK